MTSFQSTFLAPVVGAGDVRVAADWTSGAVTARFDSLVAQLYNTYHAMDTQATPPTPQQVNAVNAAVQGLLNLARNGQPDPGGGTVSFMNSQMIKVVNQIVSTFNAAGVTITFSFSNLNTANLATWKNAATTKNFFVIQEGQTAPEILKSASIAEATTKSLQSMLQLDYIATGNEVLGQQMMSLQEQLKTVQSVSNILNRLQTLHNSILAPAPRNADSSIVRTVAQDGTTTISSPPSPIIPQIAGFTTDFWAGQYNAAALQAFGGPLTPSPKGDLGGIAFNFTFPALGPTDPTPINSINGQYFTAIYNQIITQAPSFQQLQQYANQLSTQITTLQQLNFIDPSSPEFESSLQGQLQSVLNDLNNYIGPSPTATGVVNVMTPLGKQVYGFTLTPATDWTRIYPDDPQAPGFLLFGDDRKEGNSTGVDFQNANFPVTSQLTTFEANSPDFQPLLNSDGSQVTIDGMPVWKHITVHGKPATGNPLSPDFQHTVLEQYDLVVIGLPRASSFGWIMDNQDAAGLDSQTANLIQNNLTNALTGSQNFNSIQQQHLQQFMFVFQQFYQSASSMLGTINQIIQQVTQGFAR